MVTKITLQSYFPKIFGSLSLKSKWSCNIKQISRTHFRNTKFMLDEMTLWNASKFAIFLEYENPVFVFHFVFLYFSLMNALVYVDNLTRVFIRGKNKVCSTKWKKNYMGFFMIKIWQILKHLSRALSWA